MQSQVDSRGWPFVTIFFAVCALALINGAGCKSNRNWNNADATTTAKGDDDDDDDSAPLTDDDDDDILPIDSDNDGVPDSEDAFPNDPSESVDSDLDGVGDNADAFPEDPNEIADSDGDDVGDVADRFPNDPSETTDTDGDGIGDNTDAFPTDPLETVDTDADGVGDNTDAFPTDPWETADSDADGVGDNGDCNPYSASHWSDCGSCTDADGDSYGGGCNLGADCDDGENICHSGCLTYYEDQDGDSHAGAASTQSSCTDPGVSWYTMTDDECDADPNNWTGIGCSSCTDPDGDGFHSICDAYSTINGPDAAESDPNNWTSSGANNCADDDGDGYYVGCDAFITINGPDADDLDANNWTLSGVTNCTDGDSDGFYTACDAYATISGPDSNDDDVNNWTLSGVTNCADNDGDGFFAACDAYSTFPGPDFNDADVNNWTQSGYLSCNDWDNDGYYMPCDAYLTIAGPDFDAGNANVWSSNGAANCSDNDGDGWWAGCDAYTTINGPDYCDDDPDCVGPGECNSGDVLIRECGSCGTMSRECLAGVWGGWSACTDEGECQTGVEQTEACGTDIGICHIGTHNRICGDSCQWDAWDECGGDYVGATYEVCGDLLDNNCNGRTDEGCECLPVNPNAGGEIIVTGSISKLIADPSRCFIYGLVAGATSQVVVFDTSAKDEMMRIDLPFTANDFDISPDAQRLAVTHSSVNKISEIDLAGLVVTQTVSCLSDPWSIEVDNDRVVYYAEHDQDIRKIPLTGGTDLLLDSGGGYQPDIELSSDGRFLFVGESGSSKGDIVKYNVSGGGYVFADQAGNLPYPTRHVYLSPGGQHIYYAKRQLNPDNLSLVLGSTGEKVFAEDLDGTFAVGTSNVFDAATLRKVAALPFTIVAATLSKDDRELWYYSVSKGKIYYSNVEDFIGGIQLGTREFPAEPLAFYNFDELLQDPARNRLYGLDQDKNILVVINATSLVPILAIDVGGFPSDMDIDSTGDYLYIGHSDIALITVVDLAQMKFDKAIPVPDLTDTYKIESLANNRVAAIEWDQWTSLAMIDVASETVVDFISSGIYQGALSATAEGLTLFIGESGLSGSDLRKYSVSGNSFIKIDTSDYDDGYGFPYPSRVVTALPDGSGVYYAEYLLDGADLSILRYVTSENILIVTPDGDKAISASKVYRVSDGALLGSLPVVSQVQAVSPDGLTLYEAAGGSIQIVDLSAY